MKNNKKLFIILAVCFVVVISLIIILRLLTAEDTWICEKGRWVRHGNPAASQPTGFCK